MPPLGSPELDRQRTFWRLTLEMGMARERAYIDWLDQCKAVVRGLSAQEEKSRNTD